MRAGAPAPRQARSRSVHPGAVEFLAVLGSGDPGLRGDAHRRRHAVRPVRGITKKGVKGDPNALTPAQRNGLAIFTDADPNLGARCNNCHSLPVTTNHSVVDIVQGDLNRPNFQGRPVDIIEFMAMGDGGISQLRQGLLQHRRAPQRPRISVATTPRRPARRRTGSANSRIRSMATSRSRCPTSRSGNWPCSTSCLTTSCGSSSSIPGRSQPVPVLDRLGDPRQLQGAEPAQREVHRAVFPQRGFGHTAPGRGVLHARWQLSRTPTSTNLTRISKAFPGLRFPEFLPAAQRNMHDLIDFVSEGLTDARVALEKAPFDHPQLFVPNGTADATPGPGRSAGGPGRRPGVAGPRRSAPS